MYMKFVVKSTINYRKVEGLYYTCTLYMHVHINYNGKKMMAFRTYTD